MSSKTAQNSLLLSNLFKITALTHITTADTVFGDPETD